MRIAELRAKRRSRRGQKRSDRLRALPPDRWRELRETHTIIVAPSSLGFADELNETLAFLEDVRATALNSNRPAFMDLSGVRRMSPVACLMLTAEAQRCLSVRPGSVGGCDPLSTRAQFVLHSMGFYDALNIKHPNGGLKSRGVLGVHWGDANDPAASEHLASIAELSELVLQDKVFSNRALGALNEALINVQMHAYRDDLIDPQSCILNRWWCAGVVDPDENRVWIFYMDHGVGIPATTRRKFLEKLPLLEAPDHSLLKAVIDERRTSTEQPQHGRGLKSMIQLIELAGKGSITIWSGQGRYMLDQEHGEFEEASPLRKPFPGTLILWEVIAPDANRGRHGA